MFAKNRRRARAARGSIALAVGVLVAMFTIVSNGVGRVRHHRGTAAGVTVFRMGAYGPGAPSLNPFAPRTDGSYKLFPAIYPTLFTTSVAHPDSADVPELALRASYSPRAGTITYFLRPGAKWSDGQPITAADVVFTCNLELKYAHGATAGVVFPLQLVTPGGVSSCTSPSPETVVFHVKSHRFNSNVDHILDIFFILPKHIWQSRIGANGKGLASFSVKPGEVTGGPYTVQQFNPQAGQVLLKRNPYYKGNASPHAEYILWTTYSDAQAMASDLTAGRLDVAYALPPNVELSLKSNHGVKTLIGPTGRIVELLPNAWSKYKLHPELRLPSVRHAISDAINRKELLQTVYRGYGNITTSPLTPTQYGTADPSTLGNVYNVKKANTLLNAAGFKMGSNGVRMANGHPMSYNMIVDTSQYGYSRIIAILQTDLSRIGIRVTPVVLDDTAFTTRAAGPKYNFDFALLSMETLPDPSGMYITALCSQEGIFNNSGYCNPAFDAQYTRWETAGPSGVKQALRRESELFAQDLPQIPLVMESDLGAVANGWKAATPTDYQQDLGKLYVTQPQQVASN